jgi:hypothetical protein
MADHQLTWESQEEREALEDVQGCEALEEIFQPWSPASLDLVSGSQGMQEEKEAAEDARDCETLDQIFQPWSPVSQDTEAGILQDLGLLPELDGTDWGEETGIDVRPNMIREDLESYMAPPIASTSARPMEITGKFVTLLEYFYKIIKR